jgi:hypothetical protein
VIYEYIYTQKTSVSLRLAIELNFIKVYELQIIADNAATERRISVSQWSQTQAHGFTLDTGRN